MQTRGKIETVHGNGRICYQHALTRAGIAECCSVLPCVAVCCRVLSCVAVCCSVLQCVVYMVTAASATTMLSLALVFGLQYTATQFGLKFQCSYFRI